MRNTLMQYSLVKRKSFKLAAITATSAMNPHYHHSPYPDLSSPHSPQSDGMPSYHGHRGMGPANGHPMHEHLHHPAFHGAPMHHHHHYMNNVTNNGNNNTSSNNQNLANVKVCAGCGAKIMERYLLHALDRYWHNGCLKCHMCNMALADFGNSCYNRGDMILCKTDYLKLFGMTGACSGCGQTIQAHELVMRAGGNGATPPSPAGAHHVFHVPCFACSKCRAKLVCGDKYYLLNGNLVCEQDWHKLLKGSMGGQPQAPAVRKGKVGRPRRSRD